MLISGALAFDAAACCRFESLARALAGVGLQALQLAVCNYHVAALRDHHALPAKLFFEMYRAKSGANAHQPRSIEAGQNILRAIADGDRFRKNLRGENVQSDVAPDTRVNGAAIESNR